MSLINDMPKRIVDQSAETPDELATQAGYSRQWVAYYAKTMIEAGKWEKVTKKVGNRIVPAYRRKKK